MGQIIDGKAVSAKVKEEIRLETEKLKEQGIEIGLAVVIVGDDPASQVYVRNKEKACETVGFNSFKYALPAETTEEELLDLVKKLNFESFELYRSVYRRLDEMIGAKQKGSTNWMGVYHPQGWYVSSCDLLGLISNDMYGEFVEPELLLEIELYGNSIFHLDGPAALRHLDSLLQIKALKGIQWVYGAGQPSAAHWLGVLQKIQAAGKMIHIEARHGDLPALKEHLKPEWLILNTGARSVEEAREIEAYVAGWKR